MDEKNETFRRLLSEAVQFHGHLCSGQIIGVRMAMAGLRELGIKDSRSNEGRDLVIFVEIDRCPTDAIISVTGRTPGKRSIKMMDYGKMAATFVETRSGNAIRVNVKGDFGEKVRVLQETLQPRLNAEKANLEALQLIAEKDLLDIRKVKVELRPEDLPGESLGSVNCQECGELVRDKREMTREGLTLCRPCALGRDYYTIET